MASREPETVLVCREVRKAEWLGVRHEETQDPSAGGSRSDFLLLVRLEADGDEIGEVGMVFVEDSEGGVAGTGHGTGFLSHVAQQDRKLKVRLDEQHRIESTLQRGSRHECHTADVPRRAITDPLVGSHPGFRGSLIGEH